MDAQAYAATFLTLAFLTHMLAKAATAALFTLGSLPVVNTQCFSTTFFAPSLDALMNANAAPTTFSAIVSYPIVLTDAAPIALFTLGLGALMNADAAPTTVLTIGSMSIVLTDTGSTAMLTLAFLTSVFTKASTTIFATASHSLMSAYAASTTVNTIAFPAIVLAPRVLVFAFFGIVFTRFLLHLIFPGLADARAHVSACFGIFLALCLLHLIFPGLAYARAHVSACFGIFLTLCLLHLIFPGLADARAHVLHAQLFMALVLGDAVLATFETIVWQATVNAVLLGHARFFHVVCCHNIVRCKLLSSVMQPRKNKRLPGWVCHGRIVVKRKNVLVGELCLCSCNPHAKYFLVE